MSDKEIVKATLKWVNEIRTNKGFKSIRRLRKGDHSCSDCPVRNSLDDVFPHVRVFSNTISVINDGVPTTWLLPPSVQNFIWRFDKTKRLQEYESAKARKERSVSGFADSLN